MVSSETRPGFIPKEKLTAYQRWEMASFAPADARGGAAPDGERDASQPPVTLPTADEIEQIRALAHKQGYDAGYEEGTARARVEALRLHTLVENLEAALAELDRDIAGELLALAIELARQIVRETIALRPESVIPVVREALAQLPHQHASIHLHPEDAALARTHLGEPLAHAGHRVFEDESIERGGVRVESGGSQIDASLATRWRRVLQAIGHDGQWVDTGRREPAERETDEPQR